MGGGAGARDIRNSSFPRWARFYGTSPCNRILMPGSRVLDGLADSYGGHSAQATVLNPAGARSAEW